jgi:hypothetical protein
MAESVDQKAGRYLAEGRVAVLHVDRAQGRGVFRVKGSDDDPYEVGYSMGDWSCNCQARVLECAHILSCKKISAFQSVRKKIFNSGDDEITRRLAELWVDTWDAGVSCFRYLGGTMTEATSATEKAVASDSQTGAPSPGDPGADAPLTDAQKAQAGYDPAKISDEQREQLEKDEAQRRADPYTAVGREANPNFGGESFTYGEPAE